MKGILLVATNNGYYGQRAYNLAVTIKHKYDIPIALIYNHEGLSHLEERHKLMFDYLIECPEQYLYPNGVKDKFFIKVNLDKLTPFKKTLYLDADTAWNAHKDPEELFKKLEGIPFTIANRGYESNYSMWVNVEEIKKQFSIEKYLDCSSEVMYFESGEVFEKAREVHAINFNHRKIDASKPDEPCFAIAMELLEIQPHELKWTPAYWYFAKGRTNISRGQIQNNYFIISAGGAYDSNVKHVEKIYTDYVQYAFNLVKEKPFPFIKKSSMIPGRKNY